jgi:hypothetical protein
MSCEGRIFDTLSMARANMRAPSTGLLNHAELQRLWRYLTLAHVAGYCGLTPTYTKMNLFREFCAMHALLPNEHERRRLELIDVESGGRAYREVIVWALEVIACARERGELSEFTFGAMQEQILRLRAALATLYDFQFQVMPFSYMHLISTAVTWHLLSFATFQGQKFRPGVSVLESFLYPLFALIVLTFTLVGLIEVGSRIQNPFGADLEDFAVFHFVNFTAKASHQIVECKTPTTMGDPPNAPALSGGDRGSGPQNGDTSPPPQPTESPARTSSEV